jgi:HlyD family secretion protein
MKKEKQTLCLASIILILFTTFIIYKKFLYKPKKLPYKIENPERRTIKQIIESMGTMRVSEKVKIGSLVTGIIKDLPVKENEWVKKGQFLAEIDTGRDDADVRRAEGSLITAKAKYEYQKNYLGRQRHLYEKNQISLDEFEQVQRDYQTYKGDVLTAQATFDKAKQDFDNRKFFATQDGIVIRVGIAQGERVTTDLQATILFEIAQDITKMEVFLEVDEVSIGNIKAGQKVEFTVDAFPHRTFKTSIGEIGYSSKTKNGNIYYKVVIPVDNSEKILRPGMSVNAKIYVAKAENVLAVTAKAFMISSKVLKEIAKNLNYSFQPADKKEVKKMKKKGIPTETVWVVQKKYGKYGFVERIVTTKVNDDIYFEIKSGLSEKDDVIVDIKESIYLEKILKKAYKDRF